jgi:hypothetical protein
MHISELGIGEITYTHQDEKTGEFKTFAVQRLAQWLKDNPEKAEKHKYSIPVDRKFAEFVMRNRGIEAHRIARILNLTNFDPIILARMHDDTCLIIDGNHRYVVASMVEAQFMPGYVLPEEIWKPFVVEGIPKELAEFILTADSGIN